MAFYIIFLSIFSSTFAIPSSIRSSFLGLSFENCFFDTPCVAPRQCFNSTGGECTPDSSSCLCFPPVTQFCRVSSDCDPPEICVQQTINFETFCASPNVFNSLSGTSLAATPPPLPTEGNLYDDCSPGQSPCADGLVCNSTSLVSAPCDPNGRCICMTNEPPICLQQSNCAKRGTVCAIDPTFIVPTCVSREAGKRWDALQRVKISQGGLTMDPCRSSTECRGNRGCLDGFADFQECEGNRPCFCLPPNRVTCADTSECEEDLEACVDFRGVINGPICASIEARNTFTFIDPHAGDDVCPILFQEDRPQFTSRVQSQEGHHVLDFSTTNINVSLESRIIQSTASTGFDGFSKSLRVLGGPVAEPAIVGGLLASTRLRQYLVAIIGDGSFCTGVLISKRWVLSAAHCEIPKGAIVLFGPEQVNINATRGVVARVFADPRYNSRSIVPEFDIAAVELEEDAPSGFLFMKINFDRSIPKPGDPVRNIGYGLTGLERDFDGFLRQVDLITVSNAECNRRRAGLGIFGSSKDALFICAGVNRENCSPCDGDSGGPLLTYVDGDPLLLGIVSNGVGCSTINVPARFTRVSTMVSFLRHTPAVFETNS